MLGRHVGDRADDRTRLVAAAALELGDQAEVEQHDAPFAGDPHVGRLDVAMDLARRMKRQQAARELRQRQPQPIEVAGDRDLQRRQRRRREHPGAQLGHLGAAGGRHLVGGRGERPVGARHVGRAVPQVGEQIVAVEQLHREEARRGVDDEIVERDQVRVREIGEAAELALELVDLLDVGIGDGLERDPLAALPILGLIDHPHAACTDAADHLISPRAERALEHSVRIVHERGSDHSGHDHLSAPEPASELTHRVDDGPDAVAGSAPEGANFRTGSRR